MQIRYLILSLSLVALLASSAYALEVPYTFTASLSNGITVTGEVTVETTNAGFVPGGTVQFGNGITAFYFSATNGSITEVIDSSLFTPTPQTMNLVLSAVNFPEVESWDFSFSNEYYGGVLIQMVTVHSPSNSGYDEWAGNHLDGFDSPSSGVWTPPAGIVASDTATWGDVKALYR